MLDKTEIYYPENLEQGEEGYSFDRVLNEVCKGNIKLAKVIWGLCDWQFPETLLDEYLNEGEVVEYGGKFYFVYDNEEYEMFRYINNFLDKDYKKAVIAANEFREQEGLYTYPFHDVENPDWVLIYKQIKEILNWVDKFNNGLCNFLRLKIATQLIDRKYSIQSCLGFEHDWDGDSSCQAYLNKLNSHYNTHCFGEFEGKPIMLSELEPCLLLSNDGEGYKEYLLAANKISKNNGFHLVVYKNGEPQIGGAMIVQDTEQVRKVLDSVPESEQYDLMIQLRHPEYAKLYWNE